MDLDFGITQWRDLENPVTPFERGTGVTVTLESGHLPASFVLLLWDGNALRGPMRFENQEMADGYLLMQPGVQKFLIIPKP